MACSPLYSKYAHSETKDTLEEYKKQQEEQQRKDTVYLFDPGEWNGWQYLYDHGLYRFRYMNQNRASSTFLGTKSKSVAGPLMANKMEQAGESDKIFYMSRVKSISDIETLPGHKDIWKVSKVKEVSQRPDSNVEVTILYQKYGNIRNDYKPREREKTLVIKRKWNCFNELMDAILLCK